MAPTEPEKAAVCPREPVLVWDLPTRVLHWLLVAGFVGAFLLVEAPGGFLVHVILGLVVALLALLRILWGLVGTTYARFTSFPLRPRALVTYFRGAITGTARATIPHNPASAYFTLVMLAAPLGLAITGIIMSRGGRGAKEVHELLAAVMLGAAVLHVVGVAWHAWRHRDGIGLSMVHGKKAGTPAEAIESPRTAVAVAFLAVVAAWTAMLLRGHDAQTGQLQLPGVGWTIRAHDDHDRDRHHNPDRAHHHDD